MSQIELYTKLQDDPFKAVQTMGSTLAKSGMFGCEKQEQGEVLAMICFTEQMTPAQVTNKFHIIDGKLSRKAGSALAEFKKIGGKYTWKRNGQEPDQDPDNRQCVGLFELDGETQEIAFSVEDAKKAGLYKDRSTWSKMPWKMLRARIQSDAIGMLAPEIYFGDDAETPESEPRQINFAPESSQEPKTEPVNIPVEHKEPEVFEAEIVNEDEGQFPPKEETKPSPKPKPKAKAKPAPKQEPEPPKETEPDPVLLPDDRVRKIETLIGADAKIVMQALVHLGWLKKGQGVEYLAPGRADSVEKKYPQLLAKAQKLSESLATAGGAS